VGAGSALDGSSDNGVGLRPEHMTDAVWEHILSGAPLPADALPAGDGPAQAVARMRREFAYWYVAAPP
jgi:hypothetical protein